MNLVENNMYFQLIFDGGAVQNNEIDSKELISSITALNNLLREANSLLNGDRTQVKLNITSSFEKGSFKINFNAVQDVLEKIKSLLISDNTDAVLKASGIVALLLSLIKLLKFLSGKRPTRIHKLEDGSFNIYKSEKCLKIEEKTYKLYQDYKIRKAFEELTAPLEKEGITDMGLQLPNNTKFNAEFYQITKEERGCFIAPRQETDKLGSNNFTAFLNIINLSFKEKNKWYVNDGQSSFYAVIEDEAFLDAVDDNKIAFCKGDILQAQVRREQFYITNQGKITTEYFIEKILEKKSVINNQLDLFQN